MVLYNEEEGLVFRTSDHVPDVLKQILTERGWNEYDEDEGLSGSWNLWWKTQRFRKSEHDDIAPWQRLNHFPRTDAITRKDSLVRNLRRMRCVHGVHNFNFHPLAYILPNEYTKFVSDYAKEAQKHEKKNLYWICKPV
uniref:Tubulin--tyrosine ligase-like protein 9 n=1 Tax=Ciona savignyi TaxID=51511 RepID=H2YBA9_CIOSA